MATEVHMDFQRQEKVLLTYLHNKGFIQESDMLLLHAKQYEGKKDKPKFNCILNHLFSCFN